MNLPWETRKRRQRKTIGSQLAAAFRASPELFSRANAADRRLEALREARDAALSDAEDAKARRDTRGHHDALKRAHVATHALMRAEVGG